MDGSIRNSIESSPAFIQQVYQQLLESISLGELKPGERVRQSALAKRLGVSRQPVSHALQLLKHQGLLRDAGKQGVQVTPVDSEYVVQLYEARTSLESRAASLAASRVRHGLITAPQLQLLRDACEEGQSATAGAANHATLARADARFHSIIYQLSGNRVIEQMMEGQWPHLMRSMLAVLSDPGDSNVPSRAWVEHALIAESIIAGDAEEAGSRATSHMHRACLDLNRRLSGALDHAAGREADNADLAISPAAGAPKRRKKTPILIAD
jgi:DNA-binding GntR family transcriptional regulator